MQWSLGKFHGNYYARIRCGEQVQPVRELDNMPTIVHFEIPADDVEGSKKFYSELYGWKIEKFPGETPIGEYLMLTVTDDKAKIFGEGMHKRMFPEQ